jgi:hypothetical protein
MRQSRNGLVYKAIMPIRFPQAQDKTAILNEIRTKYPGASAAAPPRVWQPHNFNFQAPSDAWLRSLKPMATLTVDLRSTVAAFDVYLVGTSMSNDPVTSKIGTIREGQ